MKFDIRQTNIAKGVAIFLLLWHHLFYNLSERYDWYTPLFWIKGAPIEAFFADFGKVCVAIFMFLSGYGMFKSYEKSCKSPNLKADAVFVKNRLVKLLSSYWVVFIIFVPLGLAFGRSFIEIYGFNPVHYIADFLGLSYLLYGVDYTMNATWWYMSVIIIFYLIYPLLHKALKYSGELLLAFVLLLACMPKDFRQLTLWLLPFVFGMYASYRNVFEILSEKLNSNIKRLGVSLSLIFAFAYIRLALINHYALLDFAFSFGIILFCFYFLSNIPVINRILEEIGKYSGLIFMFHTFIYRYYFLDFIYSFKYAPVIFVVLLAICYAVAWIISKLMKITGYNKLIKRITS